MKSFKVMGLSVRTTNKNNQSQKDIDELWNRWYNEYAATKIHNKISEDLYNVYTDYQPDENGYYTVILGYVVSDLYSIPKGLVGKEIPVGKYKEFTSTGILPDCVVKTWESIHQLKFNRSYLADFDVYKPDKMNPDNATVTTYLSVK